VTLRLRLLLVVLAAAWLGSLTFRPLYKPDEARYGEISREMAQSGDWVTPRLNGFKYFEKPPLQYWATAAAFKIFGEHDWTARLWTALTALAGIALGFFAGNRLFGPPAGMLAAALLAGSPLYVMYGQFNALDMGVSFFLSAAIFAFATGQQAGERARRRWTLAGWAACALAVLSKGLIGIVLPVAAVALYILLRRDWQLLRRLELLRGGALFLAIVTPWVVAVSRANPEFLYFFFVQEHWLRFTTKMHQRAQPVWYFIPILLFGVAPWLFAALAGWTSSLRRPRDRAFSPGLFLALWALVVFVFFSVSGSKLPGYILPLFPALAVLAAGYLVQSAGRRMLIAQSLLIAAAGLALAIGAPRLVSVGGPAIDAFGNAYLPALFAVAALLAAAGAAGAAFAWKGRTPAATGIVAIGAFAAMLVAICGHRVFAPAYSAAPTIASMKAPPSRDAPFFTVDTYDHTVPWALRRTVTMVGYKDELAQAVGWEPDKFIPDMAGFARQWSSQREAYALFAVPDFDRKRKELGLPMEEVARGPRYVIVRKP
jgi:4-amino-4-deoxy-L-arabinose transferase-like glycosyltransferase